MSINLEILSLLILIVLGAHFLIFIIPFFQKKLPSNYIRNFNLTLLWAIFLFVLSTILSKVGGNVRLEDDPNTQWIYDGIYGGLIFNFIERRYTEVCSSCYSYNIKIIPLLANLAIFSMPLAFGAKKVLKKFNIKLNNLSASFVLIIISVGILYLNRSEIMLDMMEFQLL